MTMNNNGRCGMPENNKMDGSTREQQHMGQAGQHMNQAKQNMRMGSKNNELENNDQQDKDNENKKGGNCGC